MGFTVGLRSSRAEGKRGQRSSESRTKVCEKLGKVREANISKSPYDPSVIKTAMRTPPHSAPQAWDRPKPPPFPGMIGIRMRMV